MAYASTGRILRQTSYRTGASSGLGIAPAIVATGINLIGDLFGGSSLPQAQRDHKAYIDSVAARGDRSTLETIIRGGLVGPVPPWNVMINYNSGNTAPGGSKAAEFAAYRNYAAQKLQQLNASILPLGPSAPIISMTDPVFDVPTPIASRPGVSTPLAAGISPILLIAALGGAYLLTRKRA